MKKIIPLLLLCFALLSARAQNKHYYVYGTRTAFSPTMAKITINHGRSVFTHSLLAADLMTVPGFTDSVVMIDTTYAGLAIVTFDPLPTNSRLLQWITDVEALDSIIGVHRDYTDSATQQSTLGISNRFIVKLKTTTTVGTFNTYIGANDASILVGDLFGNRTYVLLADNAADNVIDMSEAYYLSGLFDYVEPDFLVPLDLSSDPSYNLQWYIDNTGSGAQYNGTPASGTSDADMDVDDAWNTTEGYPCIKIAVLDDGVDLTHPDLTNQLLPGYDALLATTGGGAYAIEPADNHGTACAGIIGAEKDNSIGISGIAPGCKLIPVKIYLNRFGTTFTSPIAAGINWAWSPTGGQADIISCSWNYGTNLVQAIEDAITDGYANGRFGLGTIFVFAFGNGNHPTVNNPPSVVPEIIAVGGTSMCDELWHNSTGISDPIATDCAATGSGTGSSFGTGLDVMAPAINLYTTDRQSSAGYNVSGDYTFFTGTSAAAPAAAGVLGLILSANPWLTAAKAREFLETTCEKIWSTTYNSSVSGQPNGTWSYEMGYGRINANDAVNAVISNPFPAALSPNGNLVLNGLNASVHVDLALNLPVVDIKWYRNDMYMGSSLVGQGYDATSCGEYYAIITDNCGRTWKTETLNVIITSTNPNVPSYNNTTYSGGSNTTWSPISLAGSEQVHVSGTLTIDGASLTIEDLNVTFDNCTDIVVINGGNLNINNSILSSCDNWKGIYVGPGSNVSMSGSVISDAFIGLYIDGNATVGAGASTFIGNNTHVVMQGVTAFGSVAFIGTQFKTLSPVMLHCINTFPSFNNPSYRKYVYVNNSSVSSAWSTDVFSGVAYSSSNPMQNAMEFHNSSNEGVSACAFDGIFTSAVYMDNCNTMFIGSGTIGTYNNTMLGYLEKAIYAHNSNNITISNNQIERNIPVSYGPVYTPMAYGTAVYLDQVTGSNVQNNKMAYFDNGAIWLDNTNGGNNTFQKNLVTLGDNGLVVSPDVHPVFGNNTATNIIDLNIICNKFIQNQIGILGSGDIKDQQPLNVDADNVFNPANVKWDLLWHDYNPSAHVFNHDNASAGAINGGTTPSITLNGSLRTNTDLGPTGVTPPGSCRGSWKMDPTTGIKDPFAQAAKTAEKVDLYPNPFEARLRLKLSGINPDATYRLQIFDLLGREVYNGQVSAVETEINSSSWDKGLYFIRLERNHSELLVRKLIKY